MGRKERFWINIMALHPSVTGSLLKLSVTYPDKTHKTFIVDCGLFQESEYSHYNESFPFDAKSIAFCVATHTHVDHIGRLPLLIKKGFCGNIYTSKVASYLLPLALEDSCKVLKGVSKRNHTKQLYSELDVDETLKHVKALDFLQTEQVDSNIEVKMYKNGHLPGAAFLYIKISYEGQPDIHLLFTGDYNCKNTFFNVPELPKEILQLPITIIQESTYGTTDSDKIVECFEENILACVGRGGTSVNMAFSLGRLQEVLYKLKQMQQSGKLSKSIPIYVDGKLGLRYTDLFLNGKLEIDIDPSELLPENLIMVSKNNRFEVLQSTDCKIIVTTSGNGNYGPAPQYILQYIRDPINLIQFTGFSTKGSLGDRLKTANTGDVVTISGMLAVKRAEVKHTTEFSAHAKADEMIEFLQKFEHINLVLINHGEISVKDSFGKRVVKEVNAKNVGILGREYLYRIGPYGFIKTIPTEFQ